MGEPTLKEKTSKGLFWGGLSSFLQQLLSLAFGLFLARLLTPSDYGLVGMLSIFTALVSALQDGGFATALINQEEARDEDYNSIFWFNIVVAAACYLVLFFCAPLIARFFRQPELIRLARWSFVGFVITSFGTAQNAYLVKNLMIRERSIANILALGISGVIGVVLAFRGFAYWAIVIQTLFFVSILTLCYWYYSPWRPKLSWRLEPLRRIFRFGFRVFVTNLTESCGTYLFSVVFGRFYTKREVGLFGQANKWNMMGYSIVKGMVSGVAQPVLVEVRSQRERQQHVFRKMVRFTSFIVFPAMFGLAFIAPEFISVALPDVWAASVPFLQILCIGGAFIPISYLFSSLVLSIGRSAEFMWTNIALLAGLILMTVLTYRLGITAMVVTYSSVYVLWLFVWFLPVRKVVGYSLVELLADMLPFMGITLVSIGGTYYLTRGIPSTALLLVAKILVTAALYVLLMWVSRAVTFRESISYLRGHFLNRFKKV